MSQTENKVQLIKKSIAFRAKYRLDQGETIKVRLLPPAFVVPHPNNRGGDPVRSLRTTQLSGTIARDGCDILEANSNAVAVEDHPSARKFQASFEKSVRLDENMVKQIANMVPSVGSLAHGHLNCTLRNMVSGMKGCECYSTVVEATKGKEKCACLNKPLLDTQGCYSMDLVKAHDKDWFVLCEKGIGWEVLTYRMDIEEPGAAKIISVALKRKNEVCMKTSHTEIMNTLVGLCKPNPSDLEGKVSWEAVRDKMLEKYDAHVDHPDFQCAFRVVMDSGGHDSVHMKDLHDFTKVYVNPKLRKMRFEAYKVICDYPLEFPRLKIASLKWAWKQPPKRGWCELPLSIADRVWDTKLTSMVNGMR